MFLNPVNRTLVRTGENNTLEHATRTVHEVEMTRNLANMFRHDLKSSVGWDATRTGSTRAESFPRYNSKAFHSEPGFRILRQNFRAHDAVG